MHNDAGPKTDSSSMAEVGRAEPFIFIPGASAGSEAQQEATGSSKDGKVASNPPEVPSPTAKSLMPSVSAATQPVGPARLPARRPQAWSDSTSTAGRSEAWTVVSLLFTFRHPHRPYPVFLPI